MLEIENYHSDKLPCLQTDSLRKTRISSGVSFLPVLHLYNNVKVVFRELKLSFLKYA